MLIFVERQDRETSLIIVLVVGLILAIVGSGPAAPGPNAPQYSQAK